MCEIILEVFRREFLNNTTDIVDISSKTMKDLEEKEINGNIVYDLKDIKNVSDINEFIKLLTRRNELVIKVTEDLNKEYTRNKDFIKQLDNLVKEKKWFKKNG